MKPLPLAPLNAWWQGLAARERLLVAVAVAAVVLAAVFGLAVQPAWRTVHTAPSEIERLDEQLRVMQRLATEARELRALPAVSVAQSAAALKAASDRLGDKGRLTIVGDRATLALNGAGTAQLRAWLSEVRLGARARPIEATLQRGPQGYSGSIVVALGGSA